MQLRSILIIASIVLAISSLLIHPIDNKDVPFEFWLIIVLPLLYLIAYVISPSEHELFLLEKKASLIGLPLLFLFLRFHNIKMPRRLIIWTFGGTMTILSLFTLSMLLLYGIDSSYMHGGTAFAMRNTISGISGVHVPYLALLNFTAALLLINQLWHKPKKWELTASIIMTAILLVLSIISASRTSFFMFFVMLIIMFYTYSTKAQSMLISSGLFLLFLLAVFLTPMKERLDQVASIFNQSRQLNTNTIDGTTIRLPIYKCSINLLQDHWLTGVGPEHLQKKLNLCYDQYPIQQLQIRDFNTHNEYLNIWLGLGLIPVIYFLFLLARSLWLSYNDLSSLIPLAMFAGACLTENLLERNISIVFFSLWFSYFMVLKPEK